MRRLLPLLMLLAACSSSEAPPADVLEREKFKQVLLQAQLVEARLNHEMVIDHRTDSPAKLYYAEMFKEQGITEEQFTRSFQYYAARPQELKAMYEAVLTDLDSLKEKGAPQPAVPR